MTFLAPVRCLALAVFAALQNHASTPPQAQPEVDLAPARLAMKSGQWAEAEAWLRSFEQAHPDSAQARYLLGTALLREGKPKESLETFTQAAKLAPPTPLDLRFVAQDYVLLNDFEDADRWITLAAEGDPADSETWYAKGRIKYTENRFAEAVASFKQSLLQTPRSVKAENNLGLAYEGLNQPEQAIHAYRQAIAWQSGDPDPSEQPFVNLGILLMDRNQLDEALGLFERAEELAPHDGAIHGDLGKLYARRGAWQQAQVELEKAVAADPGNYSLHFQLGQVYRKEGRADLAAAELKRAAAAESQNRH